MLSAEFSLLLLLFLLMLAAGEKKHDLDRNSTVLCPKTLKNADFSIQHSTFNTIPSGDVPFASVRPPDARKKPDTNSKTR